MPYLHDFGGRLRVLDIGCGNGRFALFLQENLPATELDYHGLDSDTQLLAFATESLSTAAINFQLDTADILQQPLPPQHYDLVVAFGLLHHIPGAQQRLDFMQKMATHVEQGGFCVFACWRFMDVESLRKRVHPWPDSLMREENDYLLDWQRGEEALRYCHYVDDQEHQALIAATALQEIESYMADGRNNALNHYSILRA